MRRKIILDRLEPAAQVKGGALGCVRGQSHNAKMLTRQFQQVLHQRFAHVLAP
ncbi:hypothetical protein D3C79_949780 [compost metagenome]